MWYQELSYWLGLWKKSEEYGFLKDCHSQILQQKLKDLEKAFKDGFDKTQARKLLPKFKKKGFHDSFRYPQGFKIDNRRIYLPKIGWVGFYKSQNILGKTKNATVSRQGNHWFVSIQVEYEIPDVKNINENRTIGIDLGIAKLVTLSDGTIYQPSNSFRKHEQKLTKAQRILSKKEKFSENWKRQKKKINKIHSKIKNSRYDYLHKITSEIIKNHGVIYLEDLKIINMSKSAKGTIEKPGRNVKAKSGLNKSILDQAWHELRRQLEYKAKWNGNTLITVDPKYTSQRCSHCQIVLKDNRKSQADFKCQSCGLELNADINAALNILAAGHAVTACGEGALATSMNQESLGIRKILPA